MSLITVRFLVFLSILFVLYYTFPKKFQWLLLLGGSLFFYIYASPVYFIFLLISALTTFYLARLVEPDDAGVKGRAKVKEDVKVKETAVEAKGSARIKTGAKGDVKDNEKNGAAKGSRGSKSDRRSIYVAIAIIINVGILAVLKYTGFIAEIIGTVIRRPVGIKYDFILPLGISFYTFMVVSYIVDVYKGDTKAETSFAKYLLFVCFFPQMIEGPINRYKNMKDTLYMEHAFDLAGCKRAGYRILTGLFKKVVIAGRFGVYVDRVFDNVQGYSGLTLLTATFFYVIQLYADFSGCMDMVIGISELFGVKMAENFNLPLFSKTISELWRRWHITLGTWFKDYIYYPVFRSRFSKKLKNTLSKAGIKKNAMNLVASFSLLCVWLLTGLWHGPEMHYVVWGAYYAVILIGSLLLTNSFKKFRKKLPFDCDSRGYHFFEIVRTLFIFTLGELIFRANSCADAVYIIKKIVTDFSLSISSIMDAVVPFTEDNTAVSYSAVAFVSALALFITEIFEYNGLDTFKKHKYVNAALLIVMTLLFGVFGESGFLYMAY